MDDVAWSPAVPPGHTFFSWDSDQFESLSTTAPLAQVQIHTSGADAKAAHGSASSKKPSSSSLAAHGGPASSPFSSSSRSASSNTSTKSHTHEAKPPCVDANAVREKITAAVRSWSQTDEKSDAWLCSKLTVVENGALKWNREEKRAFEAIPATQLDQMAKEVEHCIATRAATVSQGLHDKYLSYCMTKSEGAREHGQIGGGHSLYIHALCQLHGINKVPINKEAAVRSIHQAAGEGVVEAISLLGYCYEFADGVTINTERAAQCYQAAHDLGDPHGSIRLGRLLWEGVPNGLPKDRTRAPLLIEQGVAGLRLRVARNQDGLPGMSRALSELHTQMNLV